MDNLPIDSDGNTILHWAAEYDHEEVLLVLLRPPSSPSPPGIVKTKHQHKWKEQLSMKGRELGQVNGCKSHLVMARRFAQYLFSPTGLMSSRMAKETSLILYSGNDEEQDFWRHPITDSHLGGAWGGRGWRIVSYSLTKSPR